MTGTRSKINDLFEFPMEVDVSPYTVEHLANPEVPMKPDMFDLVGVLVHKGFAEHGHYYSYIRERPAAPEQSTRWVKYDDIDVTEFNSAEIPDSCFGGFTDAKDAQGIGYMKGHNAYMLFYERRKTTDPTLNTIPRTSLKVPVPDHLESEITRSNERLLREHCLFKSCHTEFVQSLLRQLRVLQNDMCSETHEVEKHAISMVLNHFHQIVSRIKDNFSSEATIRAILDFINKCAKCCWCALALLASHGTALGDLLVRSTQPKVRAQVAQFVLNALRHLRDTEPSGYGIEQSDDDDEYGVLVKDDGILAAIAQRLWALADELYSNAKAWDVYFLLVRSLADMGYHETAALLDAGFLTLSLELLVIHMDKRIKKGNPALWSTIDKRGPSFNGLIELVYSLLVRIDLCVWPVGSERKRRQKFDHSSGRFPLLSAERDLLKYWDPKENALVAVARTLETWNVARSSDFVPGKVIGLLCQADTDEAFAEALYTTIREGVEGLSAIYVEPYILAAIAYCRNCVSADYASGTVAAIARSSTQLEGQAGDVHLHFFDQVRRIHNPKIRSDYSDHFFYHLVVEHAPIWGIPLLEFNDSAVRNGTFKLLQDIVFTYDPITGPDGPIVADHWRAKVIRQLLKGCLEKLEQTFQQGSPSKRYMRPMIKAFENGCKWLQQLLQLEDPAAEELRDPNDGRLLEQCLSESTP